MSFRAMTWAASVKTQTPVQKLILLLLADRANDEGFCWPSINRIADDACISRQCVIENIKKLAALGFITVTKRTIRDAENGVEKSQTNLYHLNTWVVNVVDRGVVNDIDHPSQRGLLGVVNDIDHPSQRGLLGVVNDIDPNQSLEPINEPTIPPNPPSGGVEQVILDAGLTDRQTESLRKWLKHCQERRSRYGESALTALIEEWKNEPEQFFDESVNYSIARNYRGLYRKNEAKIAPSGRRGTL